MSQVNPQLHEWLAIVNEKSSKDSIPDSSAKSNPENEEKSSSHQSLQTTDAEYMDAVERGDMETAQRMVEEAARKAAKNTGMTLMISSLIPINHTSRDTPITLLSIKRMT